ncbi:hypothetical protein JKP88DRAFT_179587 [Tribonema minus]|uniref:Sperm-tail PG-rich repeat-containing protein 2 n=1 Tax=Tribonema minus TaxID=303371 RepID=A0A836CKD6_9STRA|nr:hypothetical protein JKP88DRAFT_179587 [Tribonema minus]
MPGLGFGARTAREEWRAGGVVAVPQINENLGPGTYNIPLDSHIAREKYQGKAPFLTTAVRKFESYAADEDAPAPGTYDVRPVLGKAGSAMPSVFKSGTKRFQRAEAAEAAAVPGPGSYLTPGGIGTGKGGKAGAHKRSSRGGGGPPGKDVTWNRIPSAPSIPVKEQAYGYEEGQHGVLIMQHAAHPGHTGCGDDRPGPLDYRPQLSATKPERRGVPDFSRGPDRLVLLEKAQANASSMPGPGYYNASPGIGADDAATRSTASGRMRPRRRTTAFASATRRAPPAAAAASPGPCTYNIPSALSAVLKRAARDQSFLSTSLRFQNARAAEGVPGPGSYRTERPPRSAQRAAARQHARLTRSRSAPVGFQSTSQRFGGGAQCGGGACASDVGPAAYDIPGMTERAARRWEKGGAGGAGAAARAFGSSARRFPVKPEAGDDDAAAMAALRDSSAQDEVAAQRQQRRRGVPMMPGGARPCALAAGAQHSSAFASTVERFRGGGAAEVGGDEAGVTPSPGQYYVEAEWSGGGKGVVAMAKTRGERFQQPKREGQHLGPGSYDAAHEMTWKGGRRGLLASGEKRFGGASSWMRAGENTPGPGAYNSELLYGNLCKSTHNIAIAEMSGKLM